jgi:Domain of unknown function (DUF4388)
MQIPLNGYLSEYSLAEIFNFIQDGYRTGVLSIEPYLDPASLSKITGESTVEQSCYYISVKGGRVMSIFYGLEYENKDLLTIGLEKKWISLDRVEELKVKLNGTTLPWGLHLKVWEIISVEQVRSIFNTQVIANIASIFAIDAGKFKFEPQAQLNYPEMTGLSLPAREAILVGLRGLTDWSRFTHKFPAPGSKLQLFSAQLQGLNLDRDERLVWRLALDRLTICQIATQQNLTIDRVSQICFRLSSIGLMKEIKVNSLTPNEMTNSVSSNTNSQVPVSTLFLNNLIEFLKQKKVASNNQSDRLS